MRSRLLNVRIECHHSRRYLLFITLGIIIEISVVVAGILLKQLYLDAKPIALDENTYRKLIILNSIVGFLGSVVLCFGLLSIIKTFKISRPALRWSYIAGITLIAYKGFDIIQTIHWQYFAYLLDTEYDIDILLSNLLLMGSVFALLIGLVRALYIAGRFSQKLETSNDNLHQEIQERHKSEALVREEEKKLSVILNALDFPVFLVDDNGLILAHNHAFPSLLKQSESLLTGYSLCELLPETVFKQGETHARRVFDGKKYADFVLCHGGHFWKTRMYPVMDGTDGVACIVVIAIDITERIHNEQERRLLETAITNAAECIMITDAEGHIEYVNPAFEAQTGYKRYEVMGRTPSVLKSGSHEEEHYRTLWQTIKQGNVWRGKFINRAKDGSLLHETATISPITEANGSISHYVAVKRNITREHSLEKQLWQSQKIESLGMLTGGIAHDLNNALSIILGETELVMERLGDEHACHHNLNTVVKTVLNSSALIKHLLAFARQNENEDKPVCIAPLIKENIRAIRAFLPSNVELVTYNTLDKEIIKAAPCEIQQILMNLLINANEAMQPAGGGIEISLDSIILENETIVTTGVLKPGTYVHLRVCDGGCGMEEEVLNRIFEPFFTTKEVGRGTGLGLSMVHGCVLRCEGQINVESERNRGTTFDIYWPQVISMTIHDAPASVRINGNGVSVIIVDDMADFNDLLAMNLRNRDYAVTTFSDATTALEYFRNNGTSADIVLVDYMMPAMNGKEFTRELHTLLPDLPVILLSGYSSDITSENAHEYGFSAMFTKPLEIDKLSKALVDLARRRCTDS